MKCHQNKNIILFVNTYREICGFEEQNVNFDRSKYYDCFVALVIADDN